MRHLVLLAFHFIVCCKPSPLEVAFDSEHPAEFKILINGSPWLKEDLSYGSRIFVRSDGQTYSTADQSLRLESKASFSNGHDLLGYYHSNQVSWSPQEIGFETQLRVYDQGDLVVFTQRFQKALNGTDIFHSKAYDH